MKCYITKDYNNNAIATDSNILVFEAIPLFLIFRTSFLVKRKPPWIQLIQSTIVTRSNQEEATIFNFSLLKHEPKLFNQDESRLLEPEQNPESTLILIQNYLECPLHRGNEIVGSRKNILPRSTNHMKCYIFNYNLNEAIFYIKNFIVLFFDFLLKFLSNPQFFNSSSFLVKREPPWMRSLILDPEFLLKFNTPNSSINEAEYAVGSDQNTLLVNAYFLYPTIGNFGQILPTQTLNHWWGKKATGNSNQLISDNLSSEENKS
jgi:hypothetical protein